MHRPRTEPPSPLLRAISDPARLASGWARVRAAGGGAGGDGQTPDAFARQSGRMLGRLSAQLRDGTYQPAGCRRFKVAKASGGLREVAIPSVRDRVALSAAAQELSPLLDPGFEDASHGYRPGRSIFTAVRQIEAARDAGFTHVVEGDIEAFFDSVPHARLIERLRPVIGAQDVTDLIGLWLAHQETDGIGLLQGSPLSPLLANFYLDAVDEAISAADVRLVRYADDFVILCRCAGSAAAALERAAQALAREGLSLNRTKSQLTAFDAGFRFLGHAFRGQAAVYDPGVPGTEPVPDVLPAPAAEAARGDDPAAGAQPGGAAGPRRRSRRMLRRPAGEGESDAPAAQAAASGAGRAGRTAARPAAATPLLPDDLGAELADLMGERPAAGTARLRSLFINSDATVLATQGQSFTVLRAGEELARLAPARLDRIEIGPKAHVSQAALRLALDHDVRVAFVNGHGATLGQLDPPLYGRSSRHLAQAAARLDPARQAGFARVFVTGRVFNQRALLRRLNRRRKLDTVDAACEGLGVILKKLTVAGTVDSLRGHEGAAGRLFWPALSACLDGWTLTTRTRQPAGDPVNIVLSFCSSLLMRDIAALLPRHGLHPGFGLLHVAVGEDYVVAADLMEEFRAPIAESLSVYLFNNHLLKGDHFDRLPAGAWGTESADDGPAEATEGAGSGAPHHEEDTPPAASQPRWRMRSEAQQILIRGYEDWIRRPLTSPATDRKTDWRGVINDQIEAFARVICTGAPADAYIPYRMDY